MSWARSAELATLTLNSTCSWPLCKNVRCLVSSARNSSRQVFGGAVDATIQRNPFMRCLRGDLAGCGVLLSTGGITRTNSSPTSSRTASAMVRRFRPKFCEDLWSNTLSRRCTEGIVEVDGVRLDVGGARDRVSVPGVIWGLGVATNLAKAQKDDWRLRVASWMLCLGMFGGCLRRSWTFTFSLSHTTSKPVRPSG